VPSGISILEGFDFKVFMNIFEKYAIFSKSMTYMIKNDDTNCRAELLLRRGCSWRGG
jgi:hypothetical protein